MPRQLSFIEYQNAPEQYQEQKQVNDFRKIFEDTKKKHYTKIPHKYLREISKELSPCQHHICEIIIDRIYGWNFDHESCKLSTEDLMDKKYCKRSILKAKKELLDMGLLLKKGRDIFCIDLDYKEKQQEPDNYPEIPQVETQEPDNYPEIPQVETQEPDNYPEIPQVETQEPDNYPEIPQVEIANCQQCGNVDNSTIQDASKVQKNPPSLIVVPGSPGLNSLKKQTEQVTEKKEKKAYVCFLASVATKMKYELLDYYVTKYGIDYFVDKLEILEDFKIDHVLISPAGYFSNALKFNYQPSKRLRDRRAAKLRAEKQELEAYQKSAQEQQEKLEEERKAEILKVKKSALTDSDFSELRKEALQSLIEQGAKAIFIMPDAIEAEANYILLNR